MSYTWKALQEIVWAAVVAALTYLSAAFAGGIPADKAAWLAIAAGAGRAIIAAIVAYFSKSGSFQAK